MHPSLLKLFDKMESDRARVLSSVSCLNEQAFKQIPAPGKWSASQILTHLVVSERLSLVYMKKKSLGIDAAGDSGILEWGKLVVLKISQRLPFRFKAPRVVVENTPEALPYAELVLAWDRARNDLKIFLEGFDERTVRKKIFKHPVAGRLDVRQAIAFFNEHVGHHVPQIRRILRRA